MIIVVESRTRDTKGINYFVSRIEDFLKKHAISNDI